MAFIQLASWSWVPYFVPFGPFCFVEDDVPPPKDAFIDRAWQKYVEVVGETTDSQRRTVAYDEFLLCLAKQRLLHAYINVAAVRSRLTFQTALTE